MKIIDSQIKQIVYQLHHDMHISYNKLALLLSTSICKRTIIKICKNTNNIINIKLNQNITNSNQLITHKSKKINLIKSIKPRRKNINKLLKKKNKSKSIIENNTINNLSIKKEIPNSLQTNEILNQQVQYNIQKTNFVEDFRQAEVIKQCYTYSNNDIIPVDMFTAPPDINSIPGTKKWCEQLGKFLAISEYNAHARTQNLTTPIFFDYEFINWIINNKAINYPDEFKQFKNNNIIQSNVFNYINTFNLQHEKMYNGMNIQRVKKCLALYYYKTFNFIVPETILYNEAIKLLDIIKEHHWLNKNFHNIENLKITLQKLIDFNPTEYTTMKLTFYFLAFYDSNK